MATKPPHLNGNTMNKMQGMMRRMVFMLCCLQAGTVTVGDTFGAEEPAAEETSTGGDEFSPLAKVELTDVENGIRQLLLEGNYRRVMAELQENPPERTFMIFVTALDLADTDVVDPLANVGHDHNFIESVGAFIPNGKPHPAEYFRKEFLSLAEANPKMKPVIADVICNTIALQLLRAVEQDRPIVLSDDILFSKEDTSAEHVLFETILREALCSTPEARKHFHELRRMMWLQKVSDAEGVTFFAGGPWISLRRLATEIDPGCVDRWWPVFARVAVDCGKQGRFTSGAFVVVHGCGDRLDGALKYLLEESKEYLTDERRITNLKIAFAYLGEAARTAEIPFPPKEDEAFDRLKKIVETTGDPKETKIAFEAAFGEK